MVCATRIVSAVWRNENPWPSENTMEKQHPNKRKQHSEPELATNRRAEIWRCASLAKLDHGLRAQLLSFRVRPPAWRHPS